MLLSARFALSRPLSVLTGKSIERALSVSASKRAPVVKGHVTPMRSVPSHIVLPNYAQSGNPTQMQEVDEIEIKTPEMIELMRAAGKIARKALTYSGTLAKVGVTTESIDKQVHDLIVAEGAYPSPLNYHGFPKAVCASVNEVICHGIPDDRPLEDGDILKIDVSIYKDGVHGDCCHTFLVGNADDEAKRLMRVTEEAMYAGINVVKPGARFNEIGVAISKVAKAEGYDIPARYSGHGIGQHLHMFPYVLHVPNTYDAVMKPGMTFTIEPMVTEGSARDVVWSDNWTVVTKDRSRAAQFENTILVTDTGFEILTVDP